MITPATRGIFCIVLSLACMGIISLAVADAAGQSTEWRTVTDSRGIDVKIPADIQRVVSISDGLVESTMIVLGVEDTLVGTGSSCIKKNYEYSFPSVKGANFTYSNGMNVAMSLYPAIGDLPLVAQSGTGVNYETLSSLEPDVVIIRLADCTIRSKDDESTLKTISTIESLGIPLVVLYGPNCYDSATVSGVSDEIRILGDVFDKEEKAEALSVYLEEQVAMIRERTEGIPDQEKPTVLVLGLSPTARNNGGAGNVEGLGTLESNFIEDIVHARNAFREKGDSKVLSAEQILALDPDKIVLCTANGYHPPRELYEAPYYQNLQELTAVKNRQVTTMPWTPCNCGKRLEYPIDVMVIAMIAYPEQFSDIRFADWILDFYRNVYGVDTDTAKQLRSVQWMDWTTG